MSQLHSLAALVQLQRLPYNTVVVEQSSKADATYFIKVGEVRVVKRVECSMPFYQKLQQDALQAAKYAPSSQTKHRCYTSSPHVHARNCHVSDPGYVYSPSQLGQSGHRTQLMHSNTPS